MYVQTNGDRRAFLLRIPRGAAAGYVTLVQPLLSCLPLSNPQTAATSCVSPLRSTLQSIRASCRASTGQPSASASMISCVTKRGLGKIGRTQAAGIPSSSRRALGTMKKWLFPVASPRLTVNRSPNVTRLRSFVRWHPVRQRSPFLDDAQPINLHFAGTWPDWSACRRTKTRRRDPPPAFDSRRRRRPMIPERRQTERRRAKTMNLEQRHPFRQVTLHLVPVVYIHEFRRNQPNGQARLPPSKHGR